VVAPFLPDAEKLAAIREALPALSAGIYLNTGSVGPLPAETAAAMADIANRERDVGRGHSTVFEESLVRLAEARAAVAAVVGTDVESVALTHSTTDAMNAGSLALDLRAGHRAVTSRSEHPGGLGQLYALRERGVEIVFVDAGADGDDARTIAAFDAAIAPGTRLVSLSHVLWTTGAVMPVAEIATLAHERGATVIVDGAQAAGAIPFRFDDLGVDLYGVSAQKWLLGPEGMGALVVAPDLLERLVPAMGGGFSFERSDGIGEAVWWRDARRFEASNYHIPSVVGMARSLGWLSMYVGLDYVHRRGPAMARAAADRLAAIDGVSVLTPLDLMATLVTFRIAGWPAQAALDELGSRVFAIARTIPSLDALRISVGFFTSEDELERLVGAVELLADHTPDTLPARRLLTILDDR
jgi:L-cysteine/cystine lyase